MGLGEVGVRLGARVGAGVRARVRVRVAYAVDLPQHLLGQVLREAVVVLDLVRVRLGFGLTSPSP